MAHSQQNPAAGRTLASTAAHTLVVVGIVLLVTVLVVIRDALVLAFVAIIIATLLNAIAAPLRTLAGMSRSVALAIVALAIVGLVGGAGWLVGAQVHAQFLDLLDRLPAALRSVHERFGITPEDLFQGDSAINGWLTNSALPSIASLGKMIVGALTGTIIAIAAGVFIAAQPDLYARGLVMLFPASQHGRVERVLGGTATALRQWLLAQGVAMLAVGVLAGLGTWMLGLPAPVAIGLLMGLLEFVPLVGPVLGALPAVVLALSESLTTMLWTLVVFTVIQQIEGNLITPIAQQKAARIPPALLLLAVVCSGLLFGFIGVLVAAPLAVVLLSLVKQLYVEDTLENGSGG